jgi:hypothetical protein
MADNRATWMFAVITVSVILAVYCSLFSIFYLIVYLPIRWLFF